MSLRRRQVGLLLRPLVRAMPWVPLVVATVISGLTLLPTLRAERPSATAAVVGLRIAAVLLGTGVAFGMVDRMAPGLVVPTPRWLRQWLRAALVAGPATAVWAVLAVVAVRTVGRTALPPLRDLVAEALVCSLVGLTGAAVAARYRHTPSAAVAGPLAQLTLIVGSLFPQGVHSPWVAPGDPRWGMVHRWWWCVLPIIAGALIAANRDTVSPRPRVGRRVRRRVTGGRHPAGARGLAG